MTKKTNWKVMLLLNTVTSIIAISMFYGMGLRGILLLIAGVVAIIFPYLMDKIKFRE